MVFSILIFGMTAIKEKSGTEWAVLDDLDLHNASIERHQVRPDQTIGLTWEDVEKAIKNFSSFPLL